jgi:aspartate/methionine/tyrosine aminotransferase
VIPGTSFSELMGGDHVRISFATKMENVVEGSRIIVEALRLKAG